MDNPPIARYAYRIGMPLLLAGVLTSLLFGLITFRSDTAKAMAAPLDSTAWPSNSAYITDTIGAAPTATLTLPGIPPGYMVIEGDIQVPIDFFKHAQSPSALITTPVALWPNGIVPYVFDGSVTAVNRTVAITAMQQWQAVANVNFVPRMGQADYISITASTGNNSPVGRQGGMQVINIASWDNIYIIAHELGHTLGFWHEQSRPDRGLYVQINYGNICQTCCPQANGTMGSCNYNFDIRPGAIAYGWYDFDSVMHYGPCSFISPLVLNCPAGGTTITPTAAYAGREIGQRRFLSYLDKTTMSFLYPYPSWRFVDANPAGQGNAGTFFNPYLQFIPGYNASPSGGTLWIQPGTYSASGTYTKPMTIRAPLGGVTLGP